MVPCHHCIKLLVLINREYMNKETVYKLVDDVLKAESYRKFLNESKITLPNMCYVRTKRSMIDTLDNPLTGNEPFIFTSLDEQTYVDSRDIESTHSSIEQMKFIEAVPHEVHIGCLRVLLNEAMKVNKHHELVGVINNEIERLEVKGSMNMMCRSVEKNESKRGIEERKSRRDGVWSINRVQNNKNVFEGVEGYLLKKIFNDAVFRMNMREATLLEEGRPGTAQMFLFMKHYLVGMYPRIVHSRIEICTTTSIPHINSEEYDIILLPQFVDPPNPFMCSIGHFILNIVDVKEKHVYIVNTLKGIRPNEYK